MTLHELFLKVFESHWESDRYINSGHAKEVLRLYASKIRPTFGEMKVETIKSQMVRDWYLKLEKTPTSANRALSVLSAIYTNAFYSGLLNDETATNPCTFVKKFTEKKRARRAANEEIERLCEELKKLKKTHPLHTIFFLTLLFTGARPLSLQKATWTDIHIMQNGFGVLMFDGKGTSDSGEKEKIILPPIAMRMLLSLGKRDDDLIFGKVHYQRIWSRVRTAAGCGNLWARDLRRTFASIGLSDGVNISTIGELLNHRSTETTKIYAKLDDTVRIKAVGQISEKIAALLGSLV